MSNKCLRCGFVTWAGVASCKRCGASLELSDQSTPSSGKVSRRRESGQTRQDVRSDALKKMKVGAAATIVYLAILTGVVITGYEIKRLSLVPFIFILPPVAWFLAGVLQMITGVPFGELSTRWDSLAGWQRGVIGVSVFLAGLIALLIVFLVILFVLDSSLV